MPTEPPPVSPDFRAYLLEIVDVTERQLDKVVAHLQDHWSETVEEFVVRRHRQLQRRGVPNRLAYGLIAQDVQSRRFQAKPLSQRQVRRILYG